MFDRRLRWVLGAIGGLWFVFLARVFHLQTAEVRDARAAVAEARQREHLVPPRRGALRDRDGRLLAEDRLGFHLLADARGLGSVEMECAACGRTLVAWESDPGPGPADRAPLPAAPPAECRCGATGARIHPTGPDRRADLADLLDGVTRADLAALIAEARRAGWSAAREAAADKERRWRRLALRDHVSRQRRLLDAIPRRAAMEVYLNPERYRGLHVDPEPVRWTDPDLPAGLRGLLGSAGAPRAEDVEGLRAEGIPYRHILRMLIGRSGIERAEDRLLRGSFGMERVVRDRYGRIVAQEVTAPVVDGEDLRVTLSADACRALEAAWPAGAEGAAVAMDPRTGGIVAFHSTSRGGVLLGASGLAPGSVMKPFTALAALGVGRAPETGTVNCIGHGSRFVSCEHHHGRIGLVEAISGSCNAYYSQAGVAAGVEALQDLADRIGIAWPLGLGINAEGGGTRWTQQVYDRPWDRTSLANLGVGQGPLALSPLQVAALYATLANGGHPVVPHLVLGHAASPGPAVVAPEHLTLVQRGLEGTVRNGTADDAGLGIFDAAGKTGTAQVPGSGLNAWFAGYAPADDPRIVVVVVVIDQRGSGGSVAAPVMTRFLADWPGWRRR